MGRPSPSQACPIATDPSPLRPRSLAGRAAPVPAATRPTRRDRRRRPLERGLPRLGRIHRRGRSGGHDALLQPRWGTATRRSRSIGHSIVEFHDAGVDAGTVAEDPGGVRHRTEADARDDGPSRRWRTQLFLAASRPDPPRGPHPGRHRSAAKTSSRSRRRRRRSERAERAAAAAGDPGTGAAAVSYEIHDGLAQYLAGAHDAPASLSSMHIGSRPRRQRNSREGICGSCGRPPRKRGG